jgi:hypothetical protein
MSKQWTRQKTRFYRYLAKPRLGATLPCDSYVKCNVSYIRKAFSNIRHAVLCNPGETYVSQLETWT